VADDDVETLPKAPKSYASATAGATFDKKPVMPSLKTAD
jgi:hypothetical protein